MVRFLKINGTSKIILVKLSEVNDPGMPLNIQKEIFIKKPSCFKNCCFKNKFSIIHGEDTLVDLKLRVK